MGRWQKAVGSGGPTAARLRCLVLVSLLTSRADGLAQGDLTALMRLYSEHGGPTWTGCTGWGQGDPCTGWGGCIECDPTNTSIVSVFIDRANVTGGFPVALCDLPSLVNVTFTRNPLSGPLPACLAGLTNLSLFSFAASNLRGTLDVIPTLSPSITAIDLSVNSLTGVIPPGLSRLTRLYRFHLTRNIITGELPVELGAMPGLRRIHFASNHFTGSLPAALTNNADFDSIDVRNNSLSGTLPLNISVWRNMTELSLGSNNFTGTLPSVEGLTLLSALLIPHNRFHGPICNMSTLVGLKQVDCSDNALSGPLPDYLNNLPVLKRIDFSSNYFSGGIPATFGQCQFTSINLYNNSLTGPIPPELNNITRLLLLVLSSNNLTGTIPPFTQSRLSWLVLCNNSLSGEVPWSVILTRTRLRRLCLGGNHFNGTLPRDLGNISRVNQLELGGNGFTGTIPDSVGQLTEMISLSLAENQFTGQIPASIGNLRRLSTLDLFSNNFSGPVPESLCGLTQLSSLVARDNSLESLPLCLGNNQTGIVSINFARNQLCGPLPPNLTKYALFVEVSKNQYESEMPPGLVVGPALRQFAAARNRFTGTIPPALLGSSSIQELDLSGSSFSGTISPLLCNATSLALLSVQGNKLTGSLPECLWDGNTMPSLTTLMIACQNSTSLPYQSCGTPFNIPADGPRSLEALLQATTTVARVDVTPLPDQNLQGTSSEPPSLLPDYGTDVQQVTQSVLLACGVVALVLVLGSTTLLPHKGGLAALDRFPQYGFVTDTVPGTLLSHEYSTKVRGTATHLGGFFNVLKAAVLLAFVIISLAVYCLEGLTLDVATQPVLNFLPPAVFNLTLSVEPLLKGAHPLLIKNVDDGWLEDLLSYRGLRAADAQKLVDDAEGTTRYDFPVGWAPENGTRSVSLYINSTDFSKAGGLRWRVQTGFVQDGVAPNAKLANEKPMITGVVVTLPTRQPYCAAYATSVAAIPYYYLEQPTFLTDNGLELLPRSDDGNALALINKACRVKTEDAHLVVPGRAGADAINGPQKLSCLDELKLFIKAVPWTQQTPKDVLGGTEAYTRKSYHLGLTGVDVEINDSYALPGLWQSPVVDQCEGCIPVTECPPMKMTVVLSQSTFGVTESLVRQEGLVKFGPGLLASCLSLAAVFLLAYELVGARVGASSPLIAWGTQIIEAARSVAGTAEAGDPAAARAALESPSPNPYHRDISGGRGLARNGTFTIAKSPDVDDAAVVYVATDAHGVVELRFELTENRDVRVAHTLGHPEGHTKSKLGLGGEHTETTKDFKSMLDAVKAVAARGMPGAEDVTLSKHLEYDTSGELRRGTLSKVSPAGGKGGVTVFTNPAFDGHADDGYMQVAPLHEPLLTAGEATA